MKHILGSQSYSTLTNVEIEDIQPNAVDLRVKKIFRLKDAPFILTKNNFKQHRGSEEIVCGHSCGFGCDPNSYYLEPGCYEIVMENEINMSRCEAGWVVTRSTLIRNGIFIVSGLYDSGYHGSMAAALHVTSGPCFIEKGARVGQFIMFEAEALHSYNGSYGFDKDGRPKKDEEKYVAG